MVNLVRALRKNVINKINYNQFEEHLSDLQTALSANKEFKRKNSQELCELLWWISVMKMELYAMKSEWLGHKFLANNLQESYEDKYQKVIKRYAPKNIRKAS